MEPCCTARNGLISMFVIVNIIVISTLIFDFSPILTKYRLYLGADEWAPISPQNGISEDVRNFGSAWTRLSGEWWEDEMQNLTDPNWRGRHKLHDKLKTGNLWYDEKVEKRFIETLEAHQFPSNCSANFFIAYRPMVSGLLSCVHVFTPIQMIGLFKGDGITVIPVGFLEYGKSPSATYDGCGEREDKHLGCFFNLTSCQIKDDPRRFSSLMKQSKSRRSEGIDWGQLVKTPPAPGGMAVVQYWMWPFTPEYERYTNVSRVPKAKFWKDLRKHGTVGVYGVPEAVEHIWGEEMEFALHSLMSSWMMKQTSSRVKSIAEEIMAKYSDAAGFPLWKPPVLAVHVRQTDKGVEDPYFVKYNQFRNLSDYVNEMEKMETEFGFQWQSMFLISDSGSALQSLAQTVNNVSGMPDSANGEKGKRFIMYDWTGDNDLIERTGGHEHIPPEMKLAAQEHFLATLYIISKISDFAIVQYSSNVGRFISELVGARHRLSCVNRVGPNALSFDYPWRHD